MHHYVAKVEFKEKQVSRPFAASYLCPTRRTVLVCGIAIPNSPIAMLWGLAKLIGGRAPSGHRQSWWADGVPVMF